VRSDRESAAGSGNQEPDARHGHHFHGRPLEDGLGRPRSGPKIRDRSYHRSPRQEPGIRIEIRWCPSHHGIEGNEIADERAKQATDEPDAHGVEWLDYKDPPGIVRKRLSPLPRSLANFKRNFAEKTWTEARDWVSRKLAKTGNVDLKYRPSEKHHRGRCQQTLRLPLLPSKDWPLPYRTIPPVDDQTPGHEMLVVPVQHPDP